MDPIRKKNLPDFLGIGCGRCGSTWLHENLKKHPQLWVTPKKEIHYFDRSDIYPSPSYLSSSNPLVRLFGMSKYSKYFRNIFFRSIFRDIVRNQSQLFWDLNYYLGRINDDWYASLFKKGKNKVKGEITPAYSLLNSQDVAKIHGMMPNLKIIIILRNPISRTWSQIRKNKQSSFSIDKISNIVDAEDMALRNDYLKTIRTWKEHFSEDRIFIGYYDDIVSNPITLLSNIYAFLGVESKAVATLNIEIAGKRINAAPKKSIPAEIKKLLIQKLLPRIKELNRNLGGYAKKWESEAISEIQKN